MKLAIVRRKNPYFAPNTWVEVTDDGVQRVQMRQKGAGVEYVRATGLVLPYAVMKEFIEPVRQVFDRDRFVF
jgi:hypothetical protein